MKRHKKHASIRKKNANRLLPAKKTPPTTKKSAVQKDDFKSSDTSMPHMTKTKQTQKPALKKLRKDKIKFGEVVKAPPIITAIPKPRLKQLTPEVAIARERALLAYKKAKELKQPGRKQFSKDNGK